MTVPSDTAKLIERLREMADAAEREGIPMTLDVSGVVVFDPDEARSLANAVERLTAERDDARLCHLEALADRDRLAAALREIHKIARGWGGHKDFARGDFVRIEATACAVLAAVAGKAERE